jgi:predicted PurR-regulated permease PerM
LPRPREGTKMGPGRTSHPEGAGRTGDSASDPVTWRGTAPLDRDRTRNLITTPRVSRVIRWGLVAWSLIGVLILAYLIYRYALYPIRVVVAPLLVAMIIVYLLNPLVSRMTVRGLPRVWATLITYVVFLGTVGMGLRYLIPLLAHQVSQFAASVPDLLTRAQDSLNQTLHRFGAENVKTSELFRALSPKGGAGSFISRIFSLTQSVVHIVVVWVLGIVLGFYLLVDLPKIRRGAMAFLPASRRDEVRSVLEKIGGALGGYFRGQLLVALFVGLASMLGLYIVGLPYWALVGAVAGLTNLIPLIGPFIGAIPAVFIAFTTNSSEGLMHLEPGWSLAVGSCLALLIVQQIDNHIISPNMLSRTVKLHPVTVMLGLLVGGTLLGLPGMLLAVPSIATIKILMLHYWDTRMQWPPKKRDEVAEAVPEVESESASRLSESRRVARAGVTRAEAG